MQLCVESNQPPAAIQFPGSQANLRSVQLEAHKARPFQGIIPLGGIALDLLHDFLAAALNLFLVDGFIWRDVAVEDRGTHIEAELRGERLDHEAANLLLLADPGYDATRIEARRGALRVRALRGPGSLALDGPVGSRVTLLPVAGDAERVRTVGLRYPLAAETLRFGRARGLSNEIAASPASVSFENGTLLIFESPQGGAT